MWVRSSPDRPDIYVEMFGLLRRIRQIHGASSVHRALHCKQFIPHVVRNSLNFWLTLNSSYVWHTKSPLQGSFSESCLVYISHNCIRESANHYTHIHKIQTWLIFLLGNLQSSLRGGRQFLKYCGDLRLYISYISKTFPAECLRQHPSTVIKKQTAILFRDFPPKEKFSYVSRTQ